LKSDSGDEADGAIRRPVSDRSSLRHDNPQGIVWQRPLQCRRFADRQKSPQFAKRGAEFLNKRKCVAAPDRKFKTLAIS
jgi:hypothetical protein